MPAKKEKNHYSSYICVDLRYIDYLKSSASSSFSREEANLLIEEFFKFFTLATRFPRRKILISKAIDLIWHFAILETKYYRKLNYDNNRGRFLDHSKLDHIKAASSVSDDKKNAFEFCLNYSRFFGDFKNETIKYWPQATLVANIKNLSCFQLNNLIMQMSEAISQSESK